MISGIIKPLIPSTVKSVPSLRQFADGLRQAQPAMAMALERAQQALDVHERALRSQSQQADEFIFTDANGEMIAWLGARDGYWGGWFGQIYVGGTFPDYKLRAFADGSLKIKDALITLTDGDKIITLDPSGPLFKFQDGASELTITGTGGGTHRIDFSIEDASDPDLFTVALNSQGEFQLNGYTHQASLDIFNYGRASQIYLGASGGTVAAPSDKDGEVGRIDFNAYNDTTFLAASSLAGIMDTGAAKLQALIDDVPIAEVHAGGIDILLGTLFLMDSGITADMPVKLSASRGLTTAKIDLGSSGDVAFTGAGAYEYIRWDGAALQTVNIATLASDLSSYFASSTHTHDVTGTAEEAGDPLHTHSVSGSTGEPV